MGLIDLVFPKRCGGCGKEGEYICRNCRRKLVKPEPICPMCCRPSVGGWTHPRCKSKWGMERLVVGLEYRGLIQRALKKVKYKNAWEIVEYLLEIWQMRELGLGQNGLESGAVVTAVPMYKQKEQERGFNQAEILAKLIAKNYKDPFFVILERVRETKPMFGLNKEERKENVVGAFEMVTNNQIRKRVILVDDVWTTGATMRECARVLKKAGVDSVWGATLAR